MKLRLAMACSVLLAGTATAEAATRTVTLNAISADGIGAEIGTVLLRDTRYGLYIEPRLKGLPPGAHGFHVHERPNCGPAPGADGKPAAGLGAGGHYDPAKTGKHLGPHAAEGHLGDLPVLWVDQDGTASLPALAPKLKLRLIGGRSLMVHAGGDNYADQPAPLGGGGARIACGLIR